MNLKTITFACAVCAILQFCMVAIWTLTNLGYLEYNESFSILGNIIGLLLNISFACFFFVVFKNQK